MDKLGKIGKIIKDAYSPPTKPDPEFRKKLLDKLSSSIKRLLKQSAPSARD